MGLFLIWAAAGCAAPGVVIPANDMLRDVYFRGAPDRPVVALTFDDGPNGVCTAEVLDALAETGAAAAFFVVGENLEDGASDWLLARMVHEGHTVGLHGYGHGVRKLTAGWLADEEIRDGAMVVNAALQRATGGAAPGLWALRPPFGLVTEPVARAAARERLVIVEWTISVGDWKRSMRADVVVDAILARVRPGDVIVLHDGDQTHQRSRARCVDRAIVPDVVRRLVPALAARGLRAAPLAEVLGLTEAASGS